MNVNQKRTSAKSTTSIQVFSSTTSYKLLTQPSIIQLEKYTITIYYVLYTRLLADIHPIMSSHISTLVRVRYERTSSLRTT